MRHLRRETKANFLAFDAAWQAELEASIAGHGGADADLFLVSYRRVASLQAWRTTLLADKLDDNSMAFFLEGQNDALSSHVLARMGSWRASLKCLRSLIENVMASLYYKDHPVEYLLWAEGSHRLDFQNYHRYFATHPELDDFSEDECGLSALKAEFATLSKAVHGSARPFRMTSDDGITQLWRPDNASARQWATRESRVILSVNKLLLAFYCYDLQGSANPNLRRSISLLATAAQRQKVRTLFGVALPAN